MLKGRILLSIIFASAFLLLVGCSALQKKVNPEQVYSTDSGFRFRFPMSGEWHPGASQNGMQVVGQKPQSDGTSVLAVVRHGPIHTGGGKSMTNQEILERFRKEVERESQGGRVSKVKSTFSQKKHKSADCLSFEQIGEDQAPRGVMNMSNDGLICLHPQRPYHFVWMAISERWPLNKSPNSKLKEDKKLFFNSLDFIQ